MRGRLIALLVAMMAAAPLGFAAAPAHAAGDFWVYGGKIPGGASAPAGPWNGVNWGSTSGGQFGVWMYDGMGGGWWQTASIGPPANLSFVSVWAHREFAAPVSWALFQPRIQTTWENRGWWGGGYGGDSGSGPVNVNNPGSLSIRVSCETGMGGSDPNPRCTGHSYWLISEIHYQLRDNYAPSGSLTDGGGPLLDGEWATTDAEAELHVTASDVGSGVYRAFLRANGTTHYTYVDPASSTCRDARPGVGGVYEYPASAGSLVPCSTASRSYTPRFDVSALGDGVHTDVTVGLEDASGHEVILASDQTIRVNGPDGDLPDPGTPCANGAHDASGTCIKRPPTSTAPPVLSGFTGPLTQGDTVYTDTGAWEDITDVVWTRAWEVCEADGSDCEPLTSGADADDSTVDDDHVTLGADVIGKRIRAVVTATTDGGTTSAPTALTDPIAALVPLNTVAPALSGTVQAGRTLTSTRGTWTQRTSGGSVTVFWQRCDAAGNGCSDIPGATGTSYELADADVARTVRTRVRATNTGGGTATAYSAVSPIVFPEAGSGGTGGAGGVDAVRPITLNGGGGHGGSSRGPLIEDPMLPVPPASGAAGVCNGTCWNGPVQLTATASQRAAVRAVRYGNKVTISGRLTAGNGQPLADVQVDVLSHLFMAGARGEIAGAATTNDNGEFTYELAPGPSRIITIGYRRSLADRSYAKHTSVKVLVAADVALRASRTRVKGGRTVVLSGRVAGAPAGTRKIAQMQVHDGKRWRTFASTRLRGSQLRFAYRFTKTTRTTAYRLRARVTNEPTWPFATATSKPVRVTVTAAKGRR